MKVGGDSGAARVASYQFAFKLVSIGRSEPIYALAGTWAFNK